MNDTYKVYRYTFPNGKVYIGVTKHSLEERRDNGYQHNKALQEAMRKFGWRNIKKDILASGLAEEDAYAEEIKQISAHRSTDPDIGFNISRGGKATFDGLSHTDEHKKYMSDLYKGKSFAPETIERMKQAHSAERKPIIRILDGSEELFESMRAAALAVGGYVSNIKRACESGKKYKGFYWNYERG